AAGDDVQLLDGGGRQLDGRTLGGGLELVLHGDAVHHVDFLADPPAAEMAVRDAGREFDRVRDAVDGEVAELAAYEHLVGDRDVRLDQPNAVHIHGHALQFEGGGLELDLQLGGPSCADLDRFDVDGPRHEQLDVEGALAHGHGGEDEAPLLGGEGAERRMGAPDFGARQRLSGLHFHHAADDGAGGLAQG